MPPWAQSLLVAGIVVAALALLARRLFVKFRKNSCGCDTCPTKGKAAADNKP